MGTMTSRERVLAALRHQEPDRVPLDLGGLTTTIETDAYNELKNFLGLKGETKRFVRDHVEPPEELLERFGIDTRYIRIKPPKNFEVRIDPDNSYVDEWGTRWKKPPGGLYWDPVAHPLKNSTIEDLETYPWPDPDDPGRVEGLREEAKNLQEKTNFAVVADQPVLGLFESAWVLLRGPEQFFTDLYFNQEFVLALMEKLADLHTRFYKKYLEKVGQYIDIIWVSDDLGTETGPLISPEHFRDFIKPYQKRLWKSIKQNTKAYLCLHTCGNVYRFIPDLIEMGVDILNPVQVSAKEMDTKRLKKEFGDRITFWGGIDTQRIMPFGTPDDVEREVKERIADLAPGGGYVLTAVHNIQPGVKPENICRMYEAALKYGNYPLSL
jgi:uroporphyrinogen decarboxylase